MKIAIIGCGSIGLRHLKNALALGCEVFVYDHDDDREGMAFASGAKFLDQAPSIDAALIATPFDQHVGWAEHFIESGTPVFVEKPLGSLDQIEDWRRLVKASEGLVTQVGYQCRFHEKWRAMRRLVPNPKRGMFTAYANMQQWPGRSYGPMLLEMSHDLDLALSAGMPMPSQSYADETHAFLKHDDWSVELRSNRESYLREWHLGDKVGAFGAAFFTNATDLGDQMYVDELRHFLNCVQSGTPTDVPLADGLRVLECCLQIEQLARQHA